MDLKYNQYQKYLVRNWVLFREVIIQKIFSFPLSNKHMQSEEREDPARKWRWDPVLIRLTDNASGGFA